MPAIRVHARHAPAAGGIPARPSDRCACLECGAPRAGGARLGAFCSPACRTAWNNRRKVRGGELYDLFMATRFERTAAAELKLWRVLNRMASLYREEDAAARGNRRSWRRPEDVLGDRPYLLVERGRV